MKKLLILTFFVFIFGNVFGQTINGNLRNTYKELIARQTRFTDRIDWHKHLYKTKVNENKFLTTHWDNEKFNPYENATIEYINIDLKEYVNPVKTNVINSHFGWRSSKTHQGVDLKAAIGDTIYASFDGKVRITKYDRSGYGFYVMIRHTNGTETLYGHLSRFLVKPNQIVKGGEPIGLAGNTGRSTGPHLHYEIRYMGIVLNPEKLIDFTTHIPIVATIQFSDELRHGGKQTASKNTNRKQRSRKRKS